MNVGTLTRPARALEQDIFTIPVPTAIVGGMRISVVDRQTAAELMITAVRERPRGRRPLYFTSANGEVIARTRADPQMARLFASADQVLADGQPLVTASRWLCRHPLPERVATTDLFHDVARLAEQGGDTFYFLGATEAESLRAVAAVRAAYPRLRLVGHVHGYLSGEALTRKLAEIDQLAPDILWLGLGVPREQHFVRDHAAKLTNVGMIKTAGGLFNHLSGKNPRAPGWMRRSGFEWLWRMLIEPRRLFWRYLTTNPQALYAIIRHSQ
ncbi:MAG: WecB/TagA/CpsF family glycosyltransferase [Devosia sp.]|nr:WecB/TagA/CpsF family glycosyltransferase [Devosia sp.]